MEFDKNSTLKLAKLARLSLNDEQLNNLETEKMENRKNGTRENHMGP